MSSKAGKGSQWKVRVLAMCAVPADLTEQCIASFFEELDLELAKLIDFDGCEEGFGRRVTSAVALAVHAADTLPPALYHLLQQPERECDGLARLALLSELDFEFVVFGDRHVTEHEGDGATGWVDQNG